MEGKTVMSGWNVFRVLASVVLIGTLSAWGWPAAADEPTSRAFLRLDVEQHTARIKRIAVDRTESIVATASEDKTIRLWSTADGVLLGVLRVPIDDGWEGQLLTVAISPDGKTVLAGGNTGSMWDGSVSLYLFDLEKKTIRTRLPKQPHVINDVAYSPDGRFVAIGYGEKAGVKVWDAANFRLIAEDKNYQGLVSSLSFDQQGRLATVAFDGTLRLYASETFAPAGTAKLSGRQPTSVAFSRDGSRIAVGFADRRAADVLSGKDLKPITTASVDGIEKGSGGAVAWARRTDGAQDLLMAGTLTKGPDQFIVRRSVEREHKDTVVSGDSINHIVPLSDGGYLFASAEPSWGRVDAQGAVTYVKGRVTADFREAHSGRFGISPNGLTIAFRPERAGGPAYRFNLLERALTPLAGTTDGAEDPASRAEFDIDPETDAKALQLTNWRNQPAPQLKKQKLELEVGEVARSVAALPDRKHFVLGGEFTLRLYDTAGKKLKQVELPGAAWTVAAARNAPFVVAALGDGSIRWYNVGPARPLLAEVLAFFPHRGGQRWALWTPEGFFDYSQSGGSEFVGFHLNDGKRNTRWMEFARAYRVFYSTDLVTAKLDPANDLMVGERLARIGDVRQLMVRRPEVRLVEYCLAPPQAGTRGLQRTETVPAPAPAPAALPCTPVTASATRGLTRRDAAGEAGASDAAVTLPADTGHIVLRFAVKSEEGHGAIQVFRNGRNATEEKVTRGLSRVAAPAAAPGPNGEAMHEGTVLLDDGDNWIEVRVFDAAGTAYQASQPLLVKKSVPAVAKAEPRRLLALVAGINKYRGDIHPLTYAQTDAKGFADVLRSKLPATYDQAASLAEMVELYDGDARKDAIKARMAALRDHARPNDVVVVYLAGHGVVKQTAPGSAVESYYFITADVEAPDDEQIRRLGLSGGEIVEALANLPTRNVLLVLDTCHAGKFATSDVRKVSEELGRPNIWAAATSTQEAIDGYPGAGKGLFFHSIARGLERGANTSDANVVFHSDLGGFVIRDVQELSKKIGYKQKAIIENSTHEDSEPIPLIVRQ